VASVKQESMQTCHTRDNYFFVLVGFWFSAPV